MVSTGGGGGGAGFAAAGVVAAFAGCEPFAAAPSVFVVEGAPLHRGVNRSEAARFAVGSATIEARVEAFNLFDAINYDQYVGSLLSFSYSQPVSAFPARRMQLAGVIRF